jgi:hypothetical protein
VFADNLIDHFKLQCITFGFHQPDQPLENACAQRASEWLIVARVQEISTAIKGTNC